jgi:selenocysteine lyase/cysteine desulfurase
MGGSYAVGKKSMALYGAGYAAAAKYINALEENIGGIHIYSEIGTTTDYEVVLGASTTQLFRNLSLALEFSPGSELILSKVDHESNISPWLDIAARQKLTIKWWLPKSKENPKLEASDLKELLSEKTVMVACTHASNVLGTIHDIKVIAQAVHTVPGALLCVDAVAYAPHRQIDVKALGVDFYSFSWYKVSSLPLILEYILTK